MTSPLFWPAYLSVLSIVALSTSSFLRSKSRKKVRVRLEMSTKTAKKEAEVVISSYGARTIQVYRFARILGCFTLLVLSVKTYLDSNSIQKRIMEWSRISEVVVLAYCTSLSIICTVYRSPGGSAYLTSILTLTFMVYAVRDLWPLLTFTLEPQDGKEGMWMWIKVGLLGLTALAIPLLQPREHIPLDPKVRSLGLSY